MNVVALIPARCGSKTIPGKNLAQVGGRSLLEWSARAALGSALLRAVLLSTDGEEIAAAGRACGVEVPFLRPAELAGDTSTSFEVAQHALAWLGAQSALPDYLLLLQPTSPLRTTADIDAAIALARERRADAVIGVTPATPHPCLARSIGPAGELTELFPSGDGARRRQDYPPAYVPNGAIYLIRTRTLLATGSFHPPGALAYVMPRERSLDIDEPFDLMLADFLLRHASA